METQDDNGHKRRLRPHAGLVAVGAVALAVVAMGCHVHGDWEKHLTNVHSTVEHERYCTDSNVSGVTQEQFSTWVGEALFHGLDDWETNVSGFLPADQGYCDDLGLSEAEIFFRLNSAPFCGEPGCTNFPATCFGHDGSSYAHNNCPFFDVVVAFESNDTAEERNNIINHEVGHVLGLADPDCDSDGSDRNCDIGTKAADRCWLTRNPLPPLLFIPRFQPVLSIMHTTGWCCPDLQVHRANGTDCSDHWVGDLAFPSEYDLASAQMVADDNPLLAD
jgi:hypothetical protein